MQRAFLAGVSRFNSCCPRFALAAAGSEDCSVGVGGCALTADRRKPHRATGRGGISVESLFSGGRPLARHRDVAGWGEDVASMRRDTRGAKKCPRSEDANEGEDQEILMDCPDWLRWSLRCSRSWRPPDLHRCRGARIRKRPYLPRCGQCRLPRWCWHRPGYRRFE